jgi:hypothetical protein
MRCSPQGFAMKRQNENANIVDASRLDAPFL